MSHTSTDLTPELNSLKSFKKRTLPKQKTPTVHTLIVAAGKGSRFGAKVAKQYTIINNETILQHSVRALSCSDAIDKAVIVIADDDEIAPSLNFELPIQFTIGGAERCESVRSGVNAIIEDGGRPTDLVLIHDAARPCIHKAHIDAVLEVASQEEYGAIVGVQVSDTLKRVEEDLTNAEVNTLPTITETVDRQNLWQAQTPQVFRLGMLQEVLEKVANEHLMITDEASAFEAMGYPIKIVKGSYQNIKLTYAEDLPLIKMIIGLKDS